MTKQTIFEKITGFFSSNENIEDEQIAEKYEKEETIEVADLNKMAVRSAVGMVIVPSAPLIRRSYYR